MLCLGENKPETKGVLGDLVAPKAASCPSDTERECPCLGSTSRPSTAVILVIVLVSAGFGRSWFYTSSDPRRSQNPDRDSHDIYRDHEGATINVKHDPEHKWYSALLRYNLD